MTVSTPRRVVIAVAFAVFQVAATFGAATAQPERHGVDLVAVALLLVGPAAIVLGERWPVLPVAASAGAACVFVGLGYPFGPIFASVVASVYMAIQAGRRLATVAVAAVAFAAFCLALVVDPKGHGPDWVHVTIAAGWVTAVIAVSEIVRARRESLAARRQREREAERQALADQRMHLAQELHDVLAHHISLINVQASVALHLIDAQPERAAEALTHIKHASAESLNELRAALEVLREGESPRAPAPRLVDVPELVERVRAGGLDVRLTIGDIPPELPAAVELVAYRIVQEALTNVTRHSTADRVEVRVTADAAALTVSIDDNGRAAQAPAERAGRGLVGMRERTESLGGTFAAGPAAAGFSVRARLPLQSGE